MYRNKVKLSGLLKWLTLPIIASTVAITCVPADYSRNLHITRNTSKLRFAVAV